MYDAAGFASGSTPRRRAKQVRGEQRARAVHKPDEPEQRPRGFGHAGTAAGTVGGHAAEHIADRSTPSPRPCGTRPGMLRSSNARVRGVVRRDGRCDGGRRESPAACWRCGSITASAGTGCRYRSGFLVLAELRKLLRDQQPPRHRPADRPLRPPRPPVIRRRSRYLTGSFAVPSGTATGRAALPHLAHDRRHLQRSRATRSWAAPARASAATSRSSTPSRSSEPRLLTPNPRTVSLELHTRDEFMPATTLNVLAAAWLQFEVHDWFSHGPNDLDEPWHISLDEGDAWPREADGDPADAARQVPPIRRRAADLGHRRHPLVGRLADLRPRQGVHRPDAHRARAARSASTRTGCSRRPGRGPRLRRRAGTHWIGLAVLHTLFTLEHNAICDRLKRGIPDVDGRPALRPGAADQRRADREDPHRRLDARDHRPPDDDVRDARALVGARPEWVSAASAGSARARSSAASPARRSTITASRTR